MKKRVSALLLAAALAVSTLILPASAAETVRFADVQDQTTATAVEVLRLMGVLDGYGDGTFRPAGLLTRAQFCKMATFAMAAEDELGLYRAVTVFPDVKPSHWAALYINLAAKGKGIIAGYPDGRFQPERTVTVGQAVTILLRLLGYKDEDIGGVWPDSYMAVGAAAGLTEGVGTDGNAALNRGQAARLFLNLLQAERADGSTLYTLSEEMEILSVDGGASTLKASDGKIYTTARPVAATSLVGIKGKLVMHKGKVLTFLPAAADVATGHGNAAVIVYEHGSNTGFEALAGNSNYRIYKNGVPADVSDLRQHDVATYYEATNSILVCDTRVEVYYESCEPNPVSPAKIRVLGGTELSVLPTAADTLSAYDPGDRMTLLLTADGQVAGAMAAGSVSAWDNALAVVDGSGTVQLLCGTNTIALGHTAEEKYYGQVVSVSADKDGKVLLGLQSMHNSDVLDVSGRTLGGKMLAENIMVFDAGTQISLQSLKDETVSENQIKYVRTNWAGQVDLIVMERPVDEVYGRVFWEDDSGELGARRIGVEYGDGKKTETYPSSRALQAGDYVAAKYHTSGLGFARVDLLTKLADVSERSWIGENTVTFGGRSYRVPKDVLCYNRNSQQWITLEQAKAYSTTLNLYEKDGVVRIIEVGR